jgi:hypothetical protein
MKINFSELLASERVRPLWGRSFTQESAMDELERLLRPSSPASEPPATAGPHDPRLHTPASGAGGAQANADAVSDASQGAADRSPDGAAHGLGQTAQADDVAGRQASTGEKTQRADADSFFTPPDLAELPIRPPHEIFADLEQAVQSDLGSRATMVRNFIEALRVRVHSVDPTADEALYHPMRHAAGGTIWELLSRLEDTLSGLRRVAAGR